MPLSLAFVMLLLIWENGTWMEKDAMGAWYQETGTLLGQGPCRVEGHRHPSMQWHRHLDSIKSEGEHRSSIKESLAS